MKKKNDRFTLKSMGGAILRSIWFGEMSIALEFTKSFGNAVSTYKLKTACFLSKDGDFLKNYEDNNLAVFQDIYRCIGSEISRISIEKTHGIILFKNGYEFIVEDVENYWDNIFSIGVMDGNEERDWIF